VGAHHCEVGQRQHRERDVAILAVGVAHLVVIQAHSPLAASMLSSIVQRRPATATSVSTSVPSGAKIK
jgi:hypothetical protein